MSLELDQLRKACPPDWDVLSFQEAVQDVTAGNPKIKQGEYEKQGALAIVDQGQDLFGGYTNDEMLACKEELPCIVFGDHTKIFKFIEQPFALGADGVKILAPIGKFDKRFLYHYLKILKLPDDAGYSRHYKFLKEKFVVKPPLAEQKRIADILDKADAIRRKRQQAIKLADDFLRATFLDMFGDPVTNPKGWGVKFFNELVNFTTGKLDSNAAVKGGRYPFFTCSKENFQIDTYAFDCEALLLAGNNAAAEYSVKYYKGRFNAYQRTYVITARENLVTYRYLQHALELKLQDLKRLSKGTNTKYLTLGILNNLQFQVPSKSSLAFFDSVIEKNEKFKYKLQDSIQLADMNFSSLTQRAFRGEL